MQQTGPQPQAAVYCLADVKKAVPQLSASHQRLGTSLGFFITQAHRLWSVADFLECSYKSSQCSVLRQALLDESMCLMQQLLKVAAACMHQLATRLFRPDAAHKAMMIAASHFCAQVVEFGVLCVTQEGQTVGVAGPLVAGEATDRNRQVLDMLQSTGDYDAVPLSANRVVPEDLC